MIQGLDRAGCRLYATEGTAAMIEAMGLPVTMTTKKLSEGHPNVVDVINDGSVGAVINTISGVSEVLRDGFHIRRTAVERQIPCFTSLGHCPGCGGKPSYGQCRLRHRHHPRLPAAGVAAVEH